LKNIADPVHIYRVAGTPHVPVPISKAATDKPSIAVLPFVNMSGDAEQQYFSDGITEDIITELSRFRSLLVIARNSSFQFRVAADVKRIARDLAVQYVVEGSVRRLSGRIRITAQLIEAGKVLTCGPSIMIAICRTYSPSRTKSPRRSLQQSTLLVFTLKEQCKHRQTLGWDRLL
jgi:TolB-like protein